jgi:hypothetical protein
MRLATFAEIILLELEPPLQRKNDVRRLFVPGLVNSVPVWSVMIISLPWSRNSISRVGAQCPLLALSGHS